MKKIGFDNEKYLQEQSACIIERVKQFDNKLYLEFGGKILYDYHASRVLPGFDPNVKMRLLQKLKDSADIIVCIYAGDIERKKMRADFGISYDADALKLIDDLHEWELNVAGVVITRFENQPSAVAFKNRLERRNVPVYLHYPIANYPADIDLVLSDNGYGKNDYIKTTRPLVVVTGPGPCSGKLSTCLSQLYHDHRAGQRAGYAKFETFPIWSIPLKHPVNIAYEAATADIRDYNEIDPFHLAAYNEVAINYNRDVEAFPVIRKILEKIMGAESLYRSPTDMGVNRAGFGIVDDTVTQDASRQEIIRRYFKYSCEYAQGLMDKETVSRVEMIMRGLDLQPEHRRVVEPARRAAAEAHDSGKGNAGVYCGAALELPNGEIVTGKNSPTFHAASSLVLNTIKKLSGIPDTIHLLSPNVIDSIGRLKKSVLHKKSISLDVEETLIALSISATTNPSAQMAMEKLQELRGAEAHTSHMLTPGDETGLRRLGLNVTSDPNFPTKDLFMH